MPRECIMSALPINYRMSVPCDQDPRCMPKELLGLLEGGGLPMVEQLLEEDKEEEQGERPPWPVRRVCCRLLSQQRLGPWGP